MSSEENTSFMKTPGEESALAETTGGKNVDGNPEEDQGSRKPEMQEGRLSENREHISEVESIDQEEIVAESKKADEGIPEKETESKGEIPTQKKEEVKDGKKTSGAEIKKKKKKKTAGYYALSFLIKIGVTALIVWALLTWVVGLYVNHSNSSYPMLKDGDLCLTYKLGTVVRGDEVAYSYEGQIRFGRIVGTAGDVVDVNEGAITVNGYGVFEDAVYPTTAEGAKIAFPYTVPQDTVFVLNDYRDDPTDSRAYGGIPLDSLRGKVIMVLRRRGI